MFFCFVWFCFNRRSLRPLQSAPSRRPLFRSSCLSRITSTREFRSRPKRLNCFVIIIEFGRFSFVHIFSRLNAKLRLLTRSDILFFFFLPSLKQQAKMAEYCRSIFGEALLIDPLDRYKVRNPCTCKERKWVKKKKRKVF